MRDDTTSVDYAGWTIDARAIEDALAEAAAVGALATLRCTARTERLLRARLSPACTVPTDDGLECAHLLTLTCRQGSVRFVVDDAGVAQGAFVIEDPDGRPLLIARNFV